MSTPAERFIESEDIDEHLYDWIENVATGELLGRQTQHALFVCLAGTPRTAAELATSALDILVHSGIKLTTEARARLLDDFRYSASFSRYLDEWERA